MHSVHHNPARLAARSTNTYDDVCTGRRKYSVDGCEGDVGDGAPVTDGGTSVPLSACSAVVSSVVIWVAFGASHLTFVLQSDAAGLAAFEEPLICVYGAGELAPAPADSATDRGQTPNYWYIPRYTGNQRGRKVTSFQLLQTQTWRATRML